jgi:hypothetical protein
VLVKALLSKGSWANKCNLIAVGVTFSNPLAFSPLESSGKIGNCIHSCLVGDSFFSSCVKLCTDELDISADFLSSFTSVLSLQAGNLGSKVTSEFEEVSKQSSID